MTQPEASGPGEAQRPAEQPAPYGYGWYYGPPPYQGPLPPAGPRNGLGLAAFICSIVGTVLGLTVFGAGTGIVLGVLAIVFGAIGRGRVSRGETDNSTQANWGFWLGIAATVISVIALVIYTVLFIRGIVHFGHVFERCVTYGNNQPPRQCING